MNIISGIILLMILPSTVLGNSLLKGETYRTRVNIEVGETTTLPIGLKVGANSKFIVLDNTNESVYTVKFVKVYKYLKYIKGKNGTSENTIYINSQVIKNRIYYISKNVGDSNKIALDDLVSKSFSGLVSGPLIVPFKYRLDDESISGEAMIGLYAGYGLDIGTVENNVAVTPFLSAGLSQVSVSATSEDGSSDTENKTGFTWAAGFLIQNWDNITIGLVYGQDRIGDSTWKHEGEGWFSVSVGWKIEL
ncbi:MAG: hypothetical protein N0E54_06345 [Candidatus Thiodiazotropha taylori]|nr:hypothetical protein [Candidatus Thiodiazotropha endolucinida]MCW4228340.1 hypothetical protein [Candidatus Thiodiazotropha taylori]